MENTNVNNIAVSIIIPVYNAKPCFQKCIDSILNQTFRNFEVIIVDDGSTDGSDLICDEYAAKDNRIKVFHRENSGVSATRNFALENAVGEFVAFIDADDYIDDKYLEVLYNDALKYKADIVCCDYLCVEGDKEYKTLPYTNKNKLITSKTGLYEDYLFNKYIYPYVVWGKIMRRTLASTKKFPSKKYGEDTSYILDIFNMSPVVYLDTYVGYFYVQWNGSAMAKEGRQIDCHISNIENNKNTIEYTSELSSKIQIEAKNKYARSVYKFISMLLKTSEKQFSDLKPFLIQNAKKACKIKEIDFKYKVMLSFFKFSPFIYCFVVGNLLKIKTKLRKTL